MIGGESLCCGTKKVASFLDGVHSGGDLRVYDFCIFYNFINNPYYLEMQYLQLELTTKAPFFMNFDLVTCKYLRWEIDSLQDCAYIVLSSSYNFINLCWRVVIFIFRRTSPSTDFLDAAD